MNNTDNYNEALAFWNSAFTLSDEDRAKKQQEINTDTDLSCLAISTQLVDFVRENLAGCTKVLDYGCGEGWAGMNLYKLGCRDVTCVDLAENAIETAKYIAGLAGIGEGYNAMAVQQNWLDSVADNTYNGIVTTCVLDVIPTEVCEYIIRNLARVATADAKIVIGLNYCHNLQPNPEKGVEIRNGNEVYMDNILRMVSHTDDEWKQMFSPYFTVEKLDYYAWNNETEKRRRMFVLTKK
ncbi:MAG: class I SAM-dependent methyltransferase [Oscillospiraceae bacterium]|nr:class I SAM-dependent methyltransferase [Oscillospiraceae bacterium]